MLQFWKGTGKSGTGKQVGRARQNTEMSALKLPLGKQQSFNLKILDKAASRDSFSESRSLRGVNYGMSHKSDRYENQDESYVSQDEESGELREDYDELQKVLDM